MMKWDHLCIPKDFGGLGILNTRFINEVLLGFYTNGRGDYIRRGRRPMLQFVETEISIK